MYIVSVLRGPDRGKEFKLVDGQTATVGSGDDSIVLSDPRVLSPHCSLTVRGGAIVLENKTASAGTFVGDKKIARGQLGPGTNFRIGDSVLAIRKDPSAGASRPTSSRETESDPLLGKIVGGYKVNEVIGRGGMGTVYKATQLSLHRDVALKVLRPKLSKDKNFRDLFINEARAAAQLVDPNVVQVYDAGSEGEISFFSMEYIGQGSVEEILEKQEKIPWEEAILMVLEAAHGLRYAESHGIVHRDIKPDNLMINDDGRIKIADLGLAKKGAGVKDAGIIGTPHFIPPEQALGKDVDSRADIYSLGCTFFRMITGKTVFTGKTGREIVLKHIKEPAPAASTAESSIPDDLDLVIARMLAKEPDQRYESSEALIGALEEVCANHGIKGSIIHRGVGKKVLVPLILLLIVGGGIIGWQATRDREVIENPAERQKRIAAEKKYAEARLKQAQAEHKQRKTELEREWGALNNEYWQRLNQAPIDKTYDVESLQEQRERGWLDLATRIESFAKAQKTLEYIPDQAREATELAAVNIRDHLDKLKRTVTHRREWEQAQIVLAGKIDMDQRMELSKLEREDRWQPAYDLCVKLTPKKPNGDDPFYELLNSSWINPIDSSRRRPATDFDEIMKVVRKSRDWFRENKKVIPGKAQQAWEPIRKKAEALSDQATDDEIATVIESLRHVERNFPDPENPKRSEAKIRAIHEKAATMRQALELSQEQRKRDRLQRDRDLVRNALRRYASLDPEIFPNRLMNLEVEEARKIWTRILARETGVSTERYRNYVQQRIDMLDWIRFLFVRFRNDTLATLADKSGGPLRSLEIEIPRPGGGRPLRPRLRKPPENIYEFRFYPGYKGETERRFGKMPLNWVHSEVFHYRGGLRWRQIDPVTRFALGAFCYETMQFSEAKKHFEALAGDPRYGEAAGALAKRAAREDAAYSEYAGIINLYQNAKASAEIDKALESLNGFYKRHEDTRFYLEVMKTGDSIQRDFVDDEQMPSLPKAPEE